MGAASVEGTPSAGGLNSRNKPFVGLATQGFVPQSPEQPAPVEPKRSERERDGATLGLSAAFPSLGVTSRDIYDATTAVPGFGTPGPPCPFRPTLRVNGNLNSKEEKLARVTRSFLGNGRLPPRRKGASFCKRSDQNIVSFPEEEGTALGAPRGVSLLS